MAVRTAQVDTSSEQDLRLGMLNTLLMTPHRNLSASHPVHEQMIAQDPLFYVRLGAWYADNGEIRDHKELFIVNLCLSNFEGHRDVGLAMLRELPPYQVERVIDFIHGRKKKVSTPVTTGTGRNQKTTHRTALTDSGLGKNIPRSVATEVKRYLTDREDDPVWFDACVLQARKSLKRVYSLLHIEPSDRAQKILFDEDPPDDSKLKAVKELRKTESAAKQAEIIIANKVPYRIASTVISAMSPTVLLALVQVMSDQELINNIGSLKRRGAFDNPDLKAFIQERLDKAKTGKRVAAMKASQVKKTTDIDEDVAKQLEDIGDAQLKSKGRIKRPTAIIIDKSGSMNIAIEVGKQIAAMTSAIMDADLFVYACDEMAYPIVSSGTDLASWEKALNGIFATGCTSCGVGIEMLRRNKQYVENIIMITDEGENRSPSFLSSILNYMKDMDTRPNVLFVKCGTHRDTLEQRCRNNDIDYDAYIFNGDYYSLPGLIPLLTKPSKIDLLMEIMSYTLPQRKVA